METATVSIDLPVGVFSALRESPEEFTKDMRIAAAVKWYEMGRVSQEKAAEISGLSREQFMAELFEYKVSPFQYTADEALREARYE